MKRINRYKQTFLLLAVLFTACDNYLDIAPTGRVIPESAEDFRNLLTEAYDMTPHTVGLTAFRSDELDLSVDASEMDLASYKDIWTWNDGSPDESTVAFEWKNYYTVIFIANSVIENETKMTGGTSSDVAQLAGEAYMMRALMHFTLVNLYAATYNPETAAGDKGIPLKLDTDVDRVLSRNSVAEVYASILSDIGEAQKRLNKDQWQTGLNYRFNTISAEAFKSRVYLYMKDWKNSLDASRKVLAVKSELADLNNSSGVKPPNHYTSVESIVAFEQPVTSSYQKAGRVNPSLIAEYTTGDRRRNNFYTAETSSIYKVQKGGSTEYRCSFRTGEIYLNLAEAAWQDQGTDDSVAKEYLLKLLSCRYSSAAYNTLQTNIEAMNKAGLLQEIYRQRFLELAFEGHRWFDLRRTSQARIEKTFKGQTFVLEQNDPRYTIRIPQEAINNNPNLAN